MVDLEGIKLPPKVMDAFERVRLVGLNDQNNGLIEQELSIREKYAPYTPQLRPWLVIIEVNMTETSLNTECTGENNGFLPWLSTKFFIFFNFRSRVVSLVGDHKQILCLW